MDGELCFYLHQEYSWYEDLFDQNQIAAVDSPFFYDQDRFSPWILQASRECLAYIKPVVHRGWVKTGVHVPGEKLSDLPEAELSH